MTIQERIAAAKAALEEQEAEEKAATPRPWVLAGPGNLSLGAGNDQVARNPRGGNKYEWVAEGNHNIRLLARSRDLNPARLAEARRLLGLAGNQWNSYRAEHLATAECLLGIRED
jgi:hypothetical protein